MFLAAIVCFHWHCAMCVMVCNCVCVCAPTCAHPTPSKLFAPRACTPASCGFRFRTPCVLQPPPWQPRPRS
eukprot:10260429-Alexandrium_andersonii.AAC.1